MWNTWTRGIYASHIDFGRHKRIFKNWLGLYYIYSTNTSLNDSFTVIFHNVSFKDNKI